MVKALTLECGFTFGLTPTTADSISNFNPIKEEHVRIQRHFTGYVISANDNYLIVADTTTKEEALSYLND